MNNQYMGCGMCHMNTTMYPMQLQNDRANSVDNAGDPDNADNMSNNYLTPAQQMPIMQPAPDVPETYSSVLYTAGYLRTQIGMLMRVEFLIGDSLNDRVGRLITVGDSYIILQSIEPGSVIMCDLYSIKFATIVSKELEPLYF